MKVEEMKPFKRLPRDKSKFLNPYTYDLDHEGQHIGRNITVLYPTGRIKKYIIIVDNETGERIKIWMNGKE